MEKAVWREDWPDRIYRASDNRYYDRSELDAARGLVIGLAISQVFWIAVALYFL